MDSLQSLRDQISDTQRELLLSIWQYRISTGDWVPVRVLHKLSGCKAKARPQLNDLGGSVVFEIENGESAKYGLTVLGVYLSKDGPRLEELTATYLEFTRDRALDEPLRMHMHSSEVSKALGLAETELVELGAILRIGPFTSGGGFGASEWNASLPRNIEDLPEDIRQYVQEVSCRDYDRLAPVDAITRRSYFLSRRQEQTEPSKFWFVIDDKIRSSLESDWQELQSTHREGNWKAAVVIGGGVLEGMLLDALRAREADAHNALKALRDLKRKKPIDQWKFHNMVDVAKELGLLGQATSHLGHAVRDLRNLIHPGRQLASGKKVTEREADVVFTAVKMCIDELAATSNQTRI